MNSDLVNDNLVNHIASSFVNARIAQSCINAYPGPIPESLQEAYRIQDRAIQLISQEIIGWKIGRIPANLTATFGDQFLSGPVFHRNLHFANPSQTHLVNAFKGGFCAVEGEVIFQIGHDADPTIRDWNADTIKTLIDSSHIGIEIAGSPFQGINDHGPAVTVSDFGNNQSLLVGPKIADGCLNREVTVRCALRYDDALKGQGSTQADSNGCFGALSWLANHLAARALPLKKGQWITTGAIAGVHAIGVGQLAEVSFDSIGTLKCLVE